MSSLGGSQVLSHTGITASVTCVHTKECACYVDSPDTLAWGPVVALYVIFFGFHNNYTGKSRHACVCVHAPSPGRHAVAVQERSVCVVLRCCRLLRLCRRQAISAPS